MFLRGFYEMVPRELISIFNFKELELLIAGLPDFDIADLRANINFVGYEITSP
jgi:E3 ubiquitin-protein ligase HUWE1